MTRILIIGNGIFPSKFGGTEVAIYELSKRLNLKYELFLSVTSYNKNFNSKLLKSFKIFPINEFNTNNKFLLHISRSLYLIHNLFKINPDIIICFDFFYYSFISALYSFLLKRRIIVRSEGTDLNYLDNVILNKMKYFICKFSDILLFTSIKHSANMRKFIPDKKPLFLGNGTNFSIKKIKKLNEKRYIKLIFVGRHHKVKNLSNLVKAFKILKKKFPDIYNKVKLNICGNGTQSDYLRELVKKFNLNEKIVFTGRINTKSLVKLLEYSDIFILPSFSEGFPLVIAESMNLGLSILCSNIPSLRFFLKEGKNCYFFDPKNINDISAKIKYLVENVGIINELKKNNLIDGKRYTWDIISSRLIKMIDFLSLYY